jgi:hypothetical protein
LVGSIGQIVPFTFSTRTLYYHIGTLERSWSSVSTSAIIEG